MVNRMPAFWSSKTPLPANTIARAKEEHARELEEHVHRHRTLVARMRQAIDGQEDDTDTQAGGQAEEAGLRSPSLPRSA